MVKKITPFVDLYPVSSVVVNLAESRGISWILANEMYRKYRPCVIASVYYVVKNIEYVDIVTVIFDEEGKLTLADFGDFVIYYDEIEDVYHVEVKETEKYGKDFIKYLRTIANIINEDGVCRLLVSAIYDYEAGRADITEYGISALYTVAAIVTESIRRARLEEELPIEEVIPTVKKPEKPKIEVEIPEINEIVETIKKLSDKYEVPVSDILKMIINRLRS